MILNHSLLSKSLRVTALRQLAVFLILIVSSSLSLVHAQGSTLVAGTVTALKGKAEVQRQGQVIALATGSSLLSGDAISTKKASTLHMRMTDGATIHLDASSTLQLKDYRMTHKPKDARSLMALVSGGLRTVTGWIGRLHNDKQYQVETPTAIIGVRGTDYSVVLGRLGVRATVHDGAIAMCNAGGCVDASKGQTVLAKQKDKQPNLFIDRRMNRTSVTEAMKENYRGHDSGNDNYGYAGGRLYAPNATAVSNESESNRATRSNINNRLNWQGRGNGVDPTSRGRLSQQGR